MADIHYITSEAWIEPESTRGPWLVRFFSSSKNL